jgi:cytochrome P450
VTKGLFNPWINILGRADYFYRLLSPSRRLIDDATKKLCSMLDRLADSKRMEILAGVKSDVPENEKDLLTLMIEAEIRDNEEETMSTLELRVI